MKMTMSEAIRSAMAIKMRENPDVLLFGEDVGLGNHGAYHVSGNLVEEFGVDRVRDTPITEAGFVGMGIGAAIAGLRPIVEIMMMDFTLVCMDQLCNQAAKFRYMTGGNVTLPMVIRTPEGSGFCGAAQHSQDLEGLFNHFPGLKIVCPSNAEDARGLLMSAIDDDNPVLFLENKNLYNTKFDVEEDAKPIPLGKAKTIREGKDAVIISYGQQVYLALQAAAELEKEGINVEVLDLRTLFPLDMETVKAAVEKTGRVVLLSCEVKRGAFISDIAANLVEEVFSSLKAPIVRVAALDVPIPFAAAMEKYVLPNKADVIQAVKKVVE